MSSTPPPSKAAKITGWILGILPCAMLTMSAYFKLAQPPFMAEDAVKQGWNLQTMFIIGIVELACMVLYLIPVTSILGAILLAGYLGGAIATHVKMGDGPDGFGPALIFGVLLWLGLFLREPRLRTLIPFKR